MIARKALMPMAMGTVVCPLFAIPAISRTSAAHKPIEIKAKIAVPPINVRNPKIQPEIIPQTLGFMPRNYIFLQKMQPD